MRSLSSAVFLLLSGTLAHGDQDADIMGCPTSPITQCTLIQWDLPTNVSGTVRPKGNAFNTSEVAFALISVSEQSPSVATTAPMRISGFYHRLESGDMGVSIRFRPTTEVKPGEYTALIMSFDGAMQLGKCQFDVEPTTKDCGFVGVGKNKHNFATSAGASWFGIGMNLAWVRQATSISTSFQPYMANLTAHGGNWIRVWLTDSWDILFVETGLGNYSLTNTDNIDELLRVAEQYGMKVMMCIESFNLFCSKPNAPCSWDACVYNKKNGGMLGTADQFFSDPQAQLYFKMRLQYLVARYAHSPSVFAWEFFNEVDITDGFTPHEQQTWVSIMAPFVAAMDPYKHMISTSFCCHDVPEVYNLPEISYSMTHTYGTHSHTDMADNNRYWSMLMAREYAKPTFIAEFGTGAHQQAQQAEADPTGIALHNGIWSSLMSGGASGANTWWWDSWVRPFGLYRLFDAPAKYTAAIAWHAYDWNYIGASQHAPGDCDDVPPGGPYTCAQQKSWGKCNQSFMQGFCCKTCWDCAETCTGPINLGFLSVTPWIRLAAAIGTPLADSNDGELKEKVLLWLNNKNNTWSNQNATIPKDRRVPLNPTSGVELHFGSMIPTFPLGVYHVEFMDTYTGETTVGPTALNCTTAHTCVLSAIPSFTTDIAVTLTGI